MGEARPVHTGVHLWAPSRHSPGAYCTVCDFLEFACGGHRCSGIRGQLGRPVTEDQDLTGGEDARLPAATVACATTENAPTGSPPAAPRAVRKPPKRRERTPDEWKAGVPFGYAAHHIVYEQHVRAAGGDVWDLRNRLILAEDRHAAHHSGIPLALADLPGSAYIFAAYTLGAGAAYNYLRRHYAGSDRRLEAILVLHEDEPVAA